MSTWFLPCSKSGARAHCVVLTVARYTPLRVEIPSIRLSHSGLVALGEQEVECSVLVLVARNVGLQAVVLQSAGFRVSEIAAAPATRWTRELLGLTSDEGMGRMSTCLGETRDLCHAIDRRSILGRHLYSAVATLR